MARERALIEEAAETLSRLDDELMVLTGTDEDALAAEDKAIADLEAARAAETAAAARLADVTRRDFEIRSRHKSMEVSLAERREQAAKVERQIAALDTQLREIAARAPDAKKLTALQDEAAELALAIEDAETRAIAAEERVAAAGGQARLDRETLQQANLELRGIESEASALSKMLVPAGAAEHTPVLEALTVAPGYEAALGAALGDDLDASTDAAAPAHWRFLASHDGDPRLPAGAEPLIAKVQGPAELTRRLGQIGVVARADGARLQAALVPGQRLVSLDGDLWRWDGFVAAAEAPTAAAQRLAQKNRLAEIERWQVEFKIAADAAVEADRVAQAELVAADAESRAARQTQRDLLAAIARTREALTTTERAARDTEARLAGVQEAKEQAADALVEAHERVDEIEVALELAQDSAGLDDEIAAADAAVRDTRARVMTLAGEAAALEREKKLRTDRLTAAEADRHRWAQRTEAARRQVATLQERATQARTELSTLADLPAEIEAQRQRLITGIADADRARATAADQLAAADTALREAQSGMRAAQAQVSTEREGRARIEAHLESARNRRTVEGQRIRDTLNCEPDGCLALAQFPDGAALPALDEIERQLSRLEADRDRLGGVNLQADEELTQLDEQFARHGEGTRRRRGGDREVARRHRPAQSRRQEAHRRRLQRGQYSLPAVVCDAVRRRRGAAGNDREPGGSARRRPGDHRQAAGQEAGHAVAVVGRRADADRAVADLRRVPDQSLADLRARRGRRAARRRQRRPLRHADGEDGRRHRDALPRHHPPPHDDGAHEPPVRRHDGREGYQPARLRRPRRCRAHRRRRHSRPARGELIAKRADVTPVRAARRASSCRGRRGRSVSD